MSDTYAEVSEHLGGKSAPKELSHVTVKRAKSGGHIITHHHKNHPHDEHVAKNDKDMLAHVMASIGSGAPASGDPADAEAAPDAAATAGAAPAPAPAPAAGAAAVPAPISQ